MKVFIIGGLLIAAVATGCLEPRNNKFVVLDSLKREFAGKTINISITDSLDLQRYAYLDKKRLDTSFKIFDRQKFKIAVDEGAVFIPSKVRMRPDDDGMVLIIGNKSKHGRSSGYIHYSHIAELNTMKTR